MKRRKTAELLVRCFPPFHLSRRFLLLLFRRVAVAVPAFSLFPYRSFSLCFI